MANKLRKMLGDKNAPCTRALLLLIESQSKMVVCKWCIDYAEQHFLPIFEKHRSDGDHPRNALNTARDYLNGKLKFSEAKDYIWYDVNSKKIGNPIEQAAENAILQAASVARYPSKWHALAVYFYGAAAIAYDRVGLNESAEVYTSISEDVCADMTAALQMTVKGVCNGIITDGVLKGTGLR
jgi:hypothetical protein